MTFSSIRLISYDFRLEGNFLTLMLFSIFTEKVAYHDSPPVRLTSPYPNQLQNSLQLSPLHAKTDHFRYLFHHLLSLGTPYALMLPLRTPC